MILKEQMAAILDRADHYREAEAYYEGRMGEQFSSAKLRKALRVTGHRGQHNYCKVIVESVLNRLDIANIVADNTDAQEKVDEVWRNNELDLESDEVHRRALEYGDCYALVWPDENGETLISYNSPLTTAIYYDPENPRKKLWAVKVWKTDNESTRMNVYYPDSIQKFEVDGTEITQGTNWRHVGQEDNPFGEVPVFHFRTFRPYGRPEHEPAYGPQNDINKLLATHFYSVDYQGAPQRYALAMQGEGDLVNFDDDDTDRENVESLQSEPGSLWYLKGVHGVGQFSPSDPDVFWKPINELKMSMASLTDTPFHYFTNKSNLGSGQAFRAAEAALLKKVDDRKQAFGTTWIEMFTFILKIEGIKGVLNVKWNDVESFDQLDRWDVMLKKINAGLSHRQALREAGYEDKDIERIMDERAMEAQEGEYYSRKPEARVSTDDNETFEGRNGLTEGAKDNGGRGPNENE